MQARTGTEDRHAGSNGTGSDEARHAGSCRRAGCAPYRLTRAVQVPPGVPPSQLANFHLRDQKTPRLGNEPGLIGYHAAGPSNKVPREAAVFTTRGFTRSVAEHLFAPSLLLLRILLIFRYRFDSDEPQHMHVAWGWAHGLMQYRDVFDNHMPLFHLLSAPIFAMTGDDVRVLFVARLVVLPLFFLSLLLTHSIASTLYGDRVAKWAAALLAVCPPFFLGTLEYRTDDLWVVLWLLAIAIFVSDRAPARKGWLGGFLIGLSFAVSMKTTLFVISIAGATALTYLLTHKRAGVRATVNTLRFAIAAAVAAAIVPALIYAGFALAGAGNYFEYGVFAHNRFPYEHAWRVLWFIPLYFICRPIAIRMAAAEGDIARVRRRLFLFLVCAVYFTVLSAFWPMLSLESYLPFYPLAVILLTPWLLDFVAAARGGELAIRRLAAYAAVATGIVAIVVTARPWKNEAHEEVQLVAEVLSITSPSDRVMDQKGETLFRVRPYYLVLESITNRKLRLGMLRDGIVEALVSTATHVVASEALPPKTLRFVKANYLPWGRVRVAGFRLPPLEPQQWSQIDVSVPGPYVIVGDGKVIPARIDGLPAANSHSLTAGRHRMMTDSRAGRPLLLWSGALRASDFTSRCRAAESSHIETVKVPVTTMGMRRHLPQSM